MNRPEIVIGLVGAVGTDMQPVCNALNLVLTEIGYSHSEIRLSQFLKDLPFPLATPLVESPYEDRLNAYMSAGNEWRRRTQSGDALALLAIGRIREERAAASQEADPEPAPKSNHAFILRSLKHSKEVETLRETYGPSFFLLSAYSPRQKRIETLTRQINASHNHFRLEDYEGDAIRLINRDEAEAGDKFGQQVRETFWRGDAFVDVSDVAHLEGAIQRIIQLWFGHPFHTPTRDEYLMFSAQAAAFRSASLGRQVGAVIATTDGSLISTGANEVPRAGGGIYWHEDEPDARDHVLGYDSSDAMRREMFADIVQRLQGQEWLNDNRRNLPIADLVKSLLDGDEAIMKGAEFMNLTEYQRPVHAEMTALTDAARRGIPVQGCTLYCTTFPCHGCARHIVASGIMRVVYIEPYAKSLARNLHSDAIRIEDNACSDQRVNFTPFVGVAPSRYMDFFAMAKKKRKEPEGTVSKWQPLEATPRLNGWSHYTTQYNERIALAKLEEQIPVETLEGDTT